MFRGQYIIAGFMIMVLTNAIGFCANTSQSGSMDKDDVLLGMHFTSDNGDAEARGLNGGDPINVTPGYSDYVKYMPEDLKHMSYADFWYWWYTLERYKGDERGLMELDKLVQDCLDRGMKVKIDLAYSSWWSADLDWEKGMDLVRGPENVDEWVHLCDLLARRYKGKVALWLLQGESNQLVEYWKNKPIEHAQAVFNKGYTAFKRVDPKVKISVSGAAQCMPRQGLVDWYQANIEACKGHYDDIPMNFFADINGGDEFHGLLNYRNTIREMLDKVGAKDVEIGSGESCITWLQDSYNILEIAPPTSMENFDPDKTPLCEMKQAWRMNESMGTYFGAGENKFMWWGTEFAPGAGWPWRWGFRKYQDWWGVWPEANKIPGTNIIYKYDSPDGKKADLRPWWSSAQTNPYHPMWEVYKFWAQSTPPYAEATRIPVVVNTSGARVLNIATYLRTEDRCAVLLQSDKPTPVSVTLDLSKTGWASDSQLTANYSNEAIDYATGIHTPGKSRSMQLKMEPTFTLSLPALSGFTTIIITRAAPDYSAECIKQEAIEPGIVGRASKGLVTVRNTGKSTWMKDEVSLAITGASPIKTVGKLNKDIEPGETALIPVRIPASDSPGYYTYPLRMKIGRNAWFGPSFGLSVTVTDPAIPRKLNAFREVGHIRLQWFIPGNGKTPKCYEIQRAEGLDMPFKLLARVSETHYLDNAVEMNKAYYYRVLAIDSKGRIGRPSNEDNAVAITTPRFYDAEIIESSIPEKMVAGSSVVYEVKIKNIGAKAWDIKNEDHLKFFLNATQQWGIQDENALPDVSLGKVDVVNPGDTVTLQIPLTAPEIGRYENQWIVTMDVDKKYRAYFGTPLLVETVVVAK